MFVKTKDIGISLTAQFSIDFKTKAKLITLANHSTERGKTWATKS